MPTISTVQLPLTTFASGMRHIFVPHYINLPLNIHKESSLKLLGNNLIRSPTAV